MGPHRCFGYVALHLLMALWTAAAEDTGLVHADMPAEMITAMYAPQGPSEEMEKPLAPSPRRRRTHRHPCLCLFDVDRTLTGKQNDVHRCHQNTVIKSIHDSGFGGGPLTVSNLGRHLDKTFCVRCYVGVISHGSAGGSKMKSYLVKLLNKGKPRHLWVKNTWHNIAKHSAANAVGGPLVAGVINAHKHRVAASIRDWYQNHMKVSIPRKRTHFFDDEKANVEEFQKSGYNAHQVSCKSRAKGGKKSRPIGYCGGTVAECVSTSGVHLCPNSGRRRKMEEEIEQEPSEEEETEQSPTAEDVGSSPAEMITATKVPQEPSEEEEIEQSPMAEDADLVPAEMITATNGLQEPFEEEEIEQSPTAEDAGLAPAEITATNGPQETSEEEEIEQSPTAEDAGLASAEMITATNGPQEPSGNASAVIWGGLASMEVIV